MKKDYLTSNDLKEKIVSLLVDSLSISQDQFQVSYLSNLDFGDLTSNIALVNFKNQNEHKTPVEYANYIKEIILKDGGVNKYIQGIDVVSPGFINIYIKHDILINNLISIYTLGKDFGKNNLGKGKLAIVEFSSPNIAKPFSVGHLRSTVIGAAASNLLEFSGFEVLRDNHLGDWGTQFGKIICAIKKWSSIEEISKLDDPIEKITSLYVKFHEEAKVNDSLNDEARAWFKKLEDGDIEARKIWKAAINWSLAEFSQIYDLLEVTFSHEFNAGLGLGESFFEDKMQKVIKLLESKKLLKEGQDGAKLVFFDKENTPPLMILKKDGSSLYATRDLATDLYRKENYSPDLIVNEVGSEQALYFKQIFEIEKMLGWYSEGQRVHLGHGLFLLDGKKMSTRAGKTVKLADVLLEAIKKAKEMGSKDEKNARIIGIGAIKYFDLSHQPATNINFDWDSIFNMEGNSSPYIQYTYARIQSILKKADSSKLRKVTDVNLSEEEVNIVRKLFVFDSVIVDATQNYSPNLVCSYVYELATLFNTFYNKHSVLKADNLQSFNFRLHLARATAQVIKNSLGLLGIGVVEDM